MYSVYYNKSVNKILMGRQSKEMAILSGEKVVERKTSLQGEHLNCISKGECDFTRENGYIKFISGKYKTRKT